MLDAEPDVILKRPEDSPWPVILTVAMSAGFTAMQYNYVVASNTTAVKLWQRHGFSIVGTVPRAFRHATRWPTDIHVMHRFL